MHLDIGAVFLANQIYISIQGRPSFFNLGGGGKMITIINSTEIIIKKSTKRDEYKIEFIGNGIFTRNIRHLSLTAAEKIQPTTKYLLFEADRK